MDLFLANGAGMRYVDDGRRLEVVHDATSKLYRNEGHLRFTDVTEASGAGRSDWGQTVATGDVDGDGDPDLYAALGETRTLAELIRHMIVRSSNLATNLLIEKIGAGNVTDLMRRLGAYDATVLRGVEDTKAYEAGLNNRVTAHDLLFLYKKLLDGSTFTPASRDRMLAILKAQEFNEKIPAGLPADIPVAHKTGDVTAIHHDAAIVFPPGEEPYILIVLTAGIADEAAANRVIAEVSRAVWTYRGSSPRISPSGPSSG